MQDSVDTASTDGKKTTGASSDEKNGNDAPTAEGKDTQASTATSSDQKSENTAPAPSLQELVRSAAEFGWLVAELLGRSFLLLENLPDEQDMGKLTEKSRWNGEKLVMLQGLLTPREKIRALTAHMCYLAEILGIGKACNIDHPYIDDDEKMPDPYDKKPYADAVSETVKKLCQGKFDEGENFETVRGSINERLFFWDLKINDILQEKPAVIYRAYLVGYCLGALRWWYALPGFKLDSTFKAKALQYLPVLGPYLPQFAAPGLVRCVGPWWDALGTQADTAFLSPADVQKQADDLQTQIAALQKQTGAAAPADVLKQISDLQTQITALQKQTGIVAPVGVQKQTGSTAPVDAQTQIAALQTQVDALQKQVEAAQSDGRAPADLQKQGHIWYSLIAGECDALSYVDPTIRNRPYIWQVFLSAWQFFVISAAILLLIIAAVFIVITFYKNQIVQGAAAIIALLSTGWIGQTIQKNAGDLLQKAFADADATIKGSYGTVKGSYLDRVWNAALQEAVNKAIFVPPVFDKGKQ